MSRYSFSGHETFPCKALWLKKGYDFLKAQHNFNDNDAVVYLGVGKNMVTSIRYWMKAFGLTQTDNLTPFADYFLSDISGRDPYLENTNTLWILHYSLVKNQIASLYNLLFLGLQRDLKTFDREQVNAYIKRKCSVAEQTNVYNEDTVKKDIGVLLASYVMPNSNKTLDEYNALLLDLGLIRFLDKKLILPQLFYTFLSRLLRSFYRPRTLTYATHYLAVTHSRTWGKGTSIFHLPYSPL